MRMNNFIIIYIHIYNSLKIQFIFFSKNTYVRSNEYRIFTGALRFNTHPDRTINLRSLKEPSQISNHQDIDPIGLYILIDLEIHIVFINTSKICKSGGVFIGFESLYF